MLNRRDALAEQINLAGLSWLLLAQLVVILPYTSGSYIWILPALAFSVAWRALSLSGRTGKPSWLAKLLLLVLSIGGLAVSNGLSLNLQSMVSLLLLSFAFKSIETENRRDALVVVWVAFFLIAARFLFDQSILAAGYGILSLVGVTTTLIAVQNPSLSSSALTRLKLAMGMLLTCLPLMVIIFIATPRLPPFWSMPDLSGGPQTGVSDSMTPGDIANLSQSGNLAFRASFLGPKPSQTDLYWRGMAMSHFDGKTWRPFSRPMADSELRHLLRQQLPQRKHHATPSSLTLEYELLMEASNQPWLFTLGAITKAEPDVVLGFDYRAIALNKLSSTKVFNLESQLHTLRDRTIDPWVREMSLQLPAHGNPRTRELAEQMRIESDGALSYVERVMSRFTEQPYHYTLKPPTLGASDTIDHFLFDSMKGFCAHYAGSFVFMMRAAGIPARVVVGYQGGEWNEEEKFLSVRQYDAHAWAEVWLPQKGWLRFDPTARVAPDRVEKNLREAVRDEGTFLSGSLFSLSKYSWLTGVRQGWEATQYRWRKLVINYDGDSQLSFLTALLGKLNSTRLAFAAITCMVVIAMIWAIALGFFGSRKTLPVEQKLYNKFNAMLAKHQLTIDTSQTPSQQAILASNKWPLLAEDIHGFVDDYHAACYQANSATKPQLQRMRSRLKRLQKAQWSVQPSNKN